ncbi:MAG: hypothetical protein HWN67_05690 [Candidatus Helarchaeota archaeon]|nr:hypothetical protein [Candidatus Helarchaeota archaeon]
MNKKLLIALILIIGCLIAIIPLSFIGFPFPSGNPDGFEKTTFEDSRVGEPEASVLPGIDLGKFGDLILGPMGILLAFVFTIGLLYLVKKIPDLKGQPKFIIFFILAVILGCLLVIPFAIAAGSLKWKSSVSINQNNILSFSMESASLDRKKNGVETLNGTSTVTLEFFVGGFSHTIELTTESDEIGYIISTTYYTAEGPSYTISISKNVTTFGIKLAPTEEETYSLELLDDEATFTAEIEVESIKFTIEQAGSEIGHSIGFDL